jgi:GTP cyclohydrolase III
MSLVELIPAPDRIEELDLDHLRELLGEADDALARLEAKTRLYESELQRELRAKVDLCGGIGACPNPETAFTLSGSALLSARREAAHKFNQVFFMAPLCRQAQKSTP